MRKVISNGISLATIQYKEAVAKDKLEKAMKVKLFWEEELKHYSWLREQFFSKEGSKRTAKEMAEAALKESKKPMKPKEIYTAIKKQGYKGKREHIYMYLYKWNKSDSSKIRRIGNGLYTYRDAASALSSS